MAINPITTTDFKVGCIFGHSNADGWAGTDTLFDNVRPDLLPTASPIENPLLAYWKNIYVATSAQPFPGTGGTPVASDIGDVDWLELTIANPTSPSDPHPHPSPWNYPNNRGACYPRWSYNAGSTAGFSLNSDGGTLHGIEIPLAWNLSHYWGHQIGICKMAFSSTFLLRLDGGAAARTWLDPFDFSVTYSPNDPDRPVGVVDPNEGGFYGYWTPADHFDWAVQTDRLYGKWQDKMAGAKEALPDNVNLNVQFGLLWFGDNDAFGRFSDTVRENFESGVREFIKNFRHDCSVNEWTLLPEHQIRIILMRIHSGYNPNLHSPDEDTVGVCNDALDRIAKDDPFVRVVDVEDLGTMADDGVSSSFVNPTNHFGSSGYVQAAEAVMEALQAMDVEPFDAIAEHDRVTVEAFMDRVRTYYNRSRTQTDADDETLMIHGNGALDQILNTIGDNAEFLRRRAQLTLTADDSTGVITMPGYVTRVLRIEAERRPDYPLQFEMVNRGSGGKLQIILKERCAPSGSFFVHFHTRPREMTVQDEFVPLPRQLVEWLVCETAKRLSYAGTNVTLQATLTGQCRELQERCMHNLMVDQRARRIRLRTQRQMPRRGYGQGYEPPWDNG